MTSPDLDEDAVIACADLAGRTGAEEFKIGYLSDEPPHGWYAHARFRGAGCGALVALSGAGATAYRNPVMADGSRWTAEEAAKAGQCRWRRMGPKWVMGCKTEGAPA